MKKVTFRTECFIDIISFYQLLMYNDIPYDKLPNKIGEFNINPNTFVSSFYVSNEVEIEYLKNISANILDNHTLRETINFGDNPTSRTYEDFKKLYNVKSISVDCLLKIENS